MIYKFTRRQCLAAVRKNELKRGKFFHVNNEDDDGECKVCAIGAIVRHLKPMPGYDNYEVARFLTDDRFSSNDSVGDSLKDKNYLGALSIYFEKGHSKKECLEFIKKHFPVRFQVRV